MSISTTGIHPSEDTLESYALGHQPVSNAEAIEEHLLLCVSCQDRLAEVDSYVAHMKAVCRGFSEPSPIRRTAREFSRGVLQIPSSVFALAAVSLLVILAIPYFRSPGDGGSTTDVVLAASRGSEQQSHAAGYLHLNIETADLPSYPAYKITVVSPSGAELWSGEAAAAPMISVRVPTRLAAGNYWVRLSGPSAEPLREFSLRLQ